MSNSTSSAGHDPARKPGKEQFWRRTLREFAKSGQSIRAFCRERQLSEPSFYAWRRTLAEREAATRGDKAAAAVAPAFVPIRLTATPTADAAPIQIVLGGGHRILLRPPVDRAALVEIVAALRTSGTAEG
jgi:transposase